MRGGITSPSSPVSVASLYRQKETIKQQLRQLLGILPGQSVSKDRLWLKTCLDSFLTKLNAVKTPEELVTVLEKAQKEISDLRLSASQIALQKVVQKKLSEQIGSLKDILEKEVDPALRMG